MKHILIFSLFIATLCTACVDDKECNNQDERNNIVLNSVSETFIKAPSAKEQQNKTTKGTPTYAVSDMPNMGVFSYYTQASAWSAVSTTATPNRMNNLLWTQANGSWSTATPVNWDSTNDATDNYSFFAYAPIANANNGITVTSTTGTPSITYTVPTTVANQPDITVATAIDMHPSNGRVNLVHKHALTAVAIKIFGQGETVSNIRLKYISTKGTLSLNNSSGIVWSALNTASSNATEYNFGLTSTTPITSTSTPTNIVASDGYLMMIPQVLTEDAMLVVNIGGNDVAFGLLNQDVNTWEAGTIVTYTLNTFAQTTSVSYTSQELTNCYIINPSPTENLVIRIPVKRVLDSPAYANVQNWKAGVTLQSSKFLFDKTVGIRFTGTGAYDGGLSSQGTGYTDSYFELYVPRGLAKRGRFTVTLGVDGTTAPSISGSTLNGTPYYWNWTFWVTNYNPYGTKTPIEYNSDGTVWAWSVPGGKLYNVNGSVVMDRYLYAAYEGGTGAVFQFGRKDPFPRLSNLQFNNISNSCSLTSSIVQQTIAESILNHNEYIVTTSAQSYTLSWESQWNAEIGNSTLWQYSKNNKKTIYDPSPIGFRVAPGSFFNGIKDYNKQTDNTQKTTTFRPKSTLTQGLVFFAAGARGYGSTRVASGYEKVINVWSDDTYMYKYNIDGSTTTFSPPTTESMYLCPVRCVSLP